MNESEWLASSDPAAMLKAVTGFPPACATWREQEECGRRKASDRKLRLFACACRRQVAGMEWSGQSQGWADTEEYPEKEILANGVGPHTVPAIEHARLFVSDHLGEKFKPTPTHAANLLRDIVGNPFSDQRAAAYCRTYARAVDVDVHDIAEQAYRSRNSDGSLENDRLAVLADAIEECMCVNADILAHLRSSGLHARGCWAVDLILGKE